MDQIESPTQQRFKAQVVGLHVDERGFVRAGTECLGRFDKSSGMIVIKRKSKRCKSQFVAVNVREFERLGDDKSTDTQE